MDKQHKEIKTLRIQNDQLINELSKINYELDRLHGDVYDFHMIGTVEAVRQLVETHLKWAKHSLRK